MFDIFTFREKKKQKKNKGGGHLCNCTTVIYFDTLIKKIVTCVTSVKKYTGLSEQK